MAQSGLAQRAHNAQVTGSNPVPATNFEEMETAMQIMTITTNQAMVLIGLLTLIGGTSSFLVLVGKGIGYIKAYLEADSDWKEAMAEEQGRQWGRIEGAEVKVAETHEELVALRTEHNAFKCKFKPAEGN